MNRIINFFQNNIILLILITVLIGVIIYLSIDNFDNIRVPPHIEELPLQQMTSTIEQSDNEINAPNFERKNEKNTPENTIMNPGNIYRKKTGREAYEEEQYVSIYDSNFGGMLGTTMGLN